MPKAGSFKAKVKQCSGFWRLNVKALACCLSARALVFVGGAFHVFSHGRESREASQFSFRESLIPWSAPPTWPSRVPKASPPNTITLGMRFQHMHSTRTQTSDCSTQMCPSLVCWWMHLSPLTSYLRNALAPETSVVYPEHYLSERQPARKWKERCSLPSREKSRMIFKILMQLGCHRE